MVLRLSIGRYNDVVCNGHVRTQGLNHMHPRQSEVLLFYDGFELRAVDGFGRLLQEDIRRAARFVYKTVRRRQTRTGFYTWFLMLCQALKRAGCQVRINDFAAAQRNPDRPIGAAGYSSIIDRLASLPNPRLLGPGLFSSPVDIPTVFDDPRNVLYLQTCAWGEDMFRPWFGNRQRNWFGGFDVSTFTDAKAFPKSIDVLIYDKIYFNHDRLYEQTIGPFQRLLDQQGLRHATIRYGYYNNNDYQRILKSSRCMAFFAQSETQGMAYQQCLAMNVPIFAWDEGFWPNPAAAEISSQPIPCTSVPFFDERCGRRFTIASMEEDWLHFFTALERYTPRSFVASELTLDKSARLYLDAYAEVRALSPSIDVRSPPASLARSS